LQQSSGQLSTIWQCPDDPGIVQIIDQRRLPHEFVVKDLTRWQDGAAAITDMLVRGAPLIGATAAWSLYLAAREYRGRPGQRAFVLQAADALGDTRPTAVNLRWALDRIRQKLRLARDDDDLAAMLEQEARDICAEDIEISRGIGEHGLTLIEDIAARKPGLLPSR